MQSPLENPAWHALTSGHAHLAITSGNARRYPLDIGAFIAVPEITPETIHDLAQIVPEDNIVGMIYDDPIEHPAWEVQFQGRAMQMVCRVPKLIDRSGVDIVQLSEVDADAMIALTTLTQPGPFFPRTYLMGRYFGIKVDGELVAMAGERLVLEDHTEISAVCTHPDHQRKGYASMLICHVMDILMQENRTPFLHVNPENINAIKAYKKLGFKQARHIGITAYKYLPNGGE